MKDGDSDDADMDGPNSNDADGSDDDIIKAGDSKTYNFEAADADTADPNYNAAYDADDDNADAITNAKYGVCSDTYDNDDGKETKNPDIDEPDDTDTQHDPL